MDMRLYAPRDSNIDRCKVILLIITLQSMAVFNNNCISLHVNIDEVSMHFLYTPSFMFENKHLNYAYSPNTSIRVICVH